jgi:phytanoyl-CoA hydroxylase
MNTVSTSTPRARRPAALEVAASALPPLTTRFQLGRSITGEQRRFLDVHGFLVFARVASGGEVQTIGSELERIERAWIDEGRKSVNGIPLFWGKNEGRPFLQRFPFTSTFSDPIRDLVRDERFSPIRDLVGAGARIGDREKDGVVVNRYINVPGSVHPRLGWHTDGLRDLFYLRMPKPMLNIGLHLDRCPSDNGGLRLIPGSHTQGFFSMCFRKLYFLSHAPDPEEIAVETEPGDLTVHDGRLWHRVARSTRTGPASVRRSMYVPYLTDPYEPKSEASRTPFYHRMGAALRKLKSLGR